MSNIVQWELKHKHTAEGNRCDTDTIFIRREEKDGCYTITVTNTSNCGEKTDVYCDLSIGGSPLKAKLREVGDHTTCPVGKSISAYYHMGTNCASTAHGMFHGMSGTVEDKHEGCPTDNSATSSASTGSEISLVGLGLAAVFAACGLL